MRDELKFGVRANRMSHLLSVNRHSVTPKIIGQVHVLIEERLELRASEELLASSIGEDFLPDKLLLALGAHGLVLRGVEELDLLWVSNRAVSIRILTSVLVRVVLAPIVCAPFVKIFALDKRAFIALRV